MILTLFCLFNNKYLRINSISFYKNSYTELTGFAYINFSKKKSNYNNKQINKIWEKIHNSIKIKRRLTIM